jgi:hypothetical protein
LPPRKKLTDCNTFNDSSFQGLVAETEYEPPKPSQNFNFFNFKEVSTTKKPTVIVTPSPTLKLPKKPETQSSFSSFFNSEEIEKQLDQHYKPGSVYYNPVVVTPKSNSVHSVKKFANPSSISFKTVRNKNRPIEKYSYTILPKIPEEIPTTELPKYTYGLVPNAAENSPKKYTFSFLPQNNNQNQETTTQLPTYTYKELEQEPPKKYTFNILKNEKNHQETTVPPKYTYALKNEPTHSVFFGPFCALQNNDV